MEGPGDEVADPTEGIQRVEDLPPPQIVRRSRNYRRRRCPRCGQRAYRRRTALRTLRQILEQAPGLLDRRCRTSIALAKRARLRQRVARFQPLRQTLKKLFSPNLEKALTFLDDSLLPATSNAVERGNRRHRQMHKTVYRVRSRPTSRGRIALDLQCDLRAPARHPTTAILHQQRRDTG